MKHIALARRNVGHGWVLMTTDGRPWLADTVDAEASLVRMMDEAIDLLGRHPEADFTFSTRAAHEVWAAPFDRQRDVDSIEQELGRASVTIMIPIGPGQWRLLQRAHDDWFDQTDTCSAAEVHAFLRSRPEDAETIELGLGGPVEVWMRRNWDPDAVVRSRPGAFAGNVVPLVRKPSAMPLNMTNESA